MDFFRSGYASLVGPTGLPQSASDTIDRLCDRLANTPNVEDKRAALLGLKGLSRDWKGEVGQKALPTLLSELVAVANSPKGAETDLETAKILLETLQVLCEVNESSSAIDKPTPTHPRSDPSILNADSFLASPGPLHALLDLLAHQHFYVRYFSLQLFGSLFGHRPNRVQEYALTAPPPGGIGRLVEVMEDNREIIRNEALLLLLSLTSSNADIQKIVAFMGAFDRLFQIIEREGGLDGGIVTQDCLSCIGNLLRYNVSNQNYFRETSCIPSFAPLLLFPPSLATSTTTPAPGSHESQMLDGFAKQRWSPQKVINAQLVLAIIRIMVGGAGKGRTDNQKAMLISGLTRALLELALASCAPSALKAQALNVLSDILRASPPNQNFLSQLFISPLIPPTPAVPNGHYEAHNDPTSWARAEKVPAVLELISLAIGGEEGVFGREGLRTRAAAVNLFQSYVANNHEAQVAIVSTMTPPPQDNPNSGAQGPAHSAGSLLLSILKDPPTLAPPSPLDSFSSLFSSLIFASLLRNSEKCKQIARDLDPDASGGPIAPPSPADEDDRSSLVQRVVGNLMLAQREHAQRVGNPEAAREWDRVMVGYLVLLCVWLWESPLTAKEFLSEGTNLQVLIEPITQASGVDSLVQGLCAFLLGICYEYNRDPGPITRADLHPIIHSRIGPDLFVNRILRLREDERFKNLGPDVLEMIDEIEEGMEDADDGPWFDWSFVEFLKNNYISVQRSIFLDPGSSEGTRSISGAGESTELIAGLRTTVDQQTREIQNLKRRIVDLEAEHAEERKTISEEVHTLTEKVAELQSDLTSAETKVSESEKEHEDLLVLLEEYSDKRKKDKAKMKEAGLDVSDDEEEDGDEQEGE